MKKAMFAIVLMRALTVPSVTNAQIKSGVIQTNGTRIAYEEQGQGRPVVLIHGANLDRTMWDDQVPELARHYRVIRYDVRGFGKSARNVEQPYGLHEDLLGLLDSLHVDKADLVGLSLGGRVAIDFALAYPNRVRSLVLAAPAVTGAPFDATEPWIADYMKALQAKDTIGAADAWLRSTAMAPAMTRPELVGRVRSLTYRNSGVLAGPPPRERVPQPLAWTRLTEVKAPTLLLIGKRDSPLLRMISDTVSARIPGLQRVEIADSGHLLNIEQPAAFTRALLQFLK
jgi:3-oxoadipate enol-lactonase